MSPDIEKLRELFEVRDVGGFLTAYQDYRKQSGIDPVVTGLTQRVFPPLLRDAFNTEQLAPAGIVLLWRLVRDSRLLLIEDDLLIGINLRINQAIKVVEPGTKLPVQALATFEDLKSSDRHRRPSTPNPLPGDGSAPFTEVKRIAIESAFLFDARAPVDAFNFRKNLCASRQESEFLRAVRQYFPSLQAYPNQPLCNFIDIAKLEATVPLHARTYAWSAQVNVLLCTTDEDPVMCIELDSFNHDSEEVVERDGLKNLLFKLAGLPLVRIRAADTTAVRAEDFYDLLMAESTTLDTLRPRRLRPRRTMERRRGNLNKNAGE